MDKKLKILVKCPCGKMVEFTPGRMRKGHGKYCSRVCYYKYRINFNVSALSHKLKGEKRECLACKYETRIGHTCC